MPATLQEYLFASSIIGLLSPVFLDRSFVGIVAFGALWSLVLSPGVFAAESDDDKNYLVLTLWIGSLLGLWYSYLAAGPFYDQGLGSRRLTHIIVVPRIPFPFLVSALFFGIAAGIYGYVAAVDDSVRAFFDFTDNEVANAFIAGGFGLLALFFVAGHVWAFSESGSKWVDKLYGDVLWFLGFVGAIVLEIFLLTITYNSTNSTADNVSKIFVSGAVIVVLLGMLIYYTRNQDRYHYTNIGLLIAIIGFHVAGYFALSETSVASAFTDIGIAYGVFAAVLFIFTLVTLIGTNGDYYNSQGSSVEYQELPPEKEEEEELERPQQTAAGTLLVPRITQRRRKTGTHFLDELSATDRRKKK